MRTHGERSTGARDWSRAFVSAIEAATSSAIAKLCALPSGHP